MIIGLLCMLDCFRMAFGWMVLGVHCSLVDHLLKVHRKYDNDATGFCNYLVYSCKFGWMVVGVHCSLVDHLLKWKAIFLRLEISTFKPQSNLVMSISHLCGFMFKSVSVYVSVLWRNWSYLHHFTPCTTKQPGDIWPSIGISRDTGFEILVMAGYSYTSPFHTCSILSSYVYCSGKK